MSAISVVSTLRDEVESIDSFLRALARQTRLPNEVVLVDGGSTDGTVARIREAQPAYPVRLKLIEAPGTNISQGRNAGISETTAEVIAVTDAGTIPEPDWLAAITAPFDRDPDLAVSSGFFRPGGSTFFQRTLAVVITPQRHEIDPERFLPSSRSVAFRRGWWARIGGYPEWLDYCEDLVFDLELKRAGASFGFQPDAVVAWDARRSLTAFARQYFNYARGDGHASLYRRRHLIRYSAYAAGVVLLAQSPRRPALGALLLGGVATHMRRFARRLRRIPAADTPGGRAAAFALMPLIVVVGDVAKMVGYPIGCWERRTGRISERAPEPGSAGRR
jgi:GT2 family glycosyltransferase